MPKTFRLLLAAGGTGGHLFPGVAVAEAAQREVDAAVLFVGTQSGMEKEVIPRFGFTLRFIPAEQFRGRKWWGQLRAVWVAGCGIDDNICSCERKDGAQVIKKRENAGELVSDCQDRR